MSDLVEASSVTVKTMADGTLRLSVDIEPMHARAGFELFGSPGTQMVLGRLKTAAEAAKQEQPTKPAGPLCKWVAIQCKEPYFQQWVIEKTNGFSDGPPEKWAAQYVRDACKVDSRADIDGNKIAEARLHTLIRQPYADWLAARGGK